jgi:hypothetical protein
LESILNGKSHEAFSFLKQYSDAHPDIVREKFNLIISDPYASLCFIMSCPHSESQRQLALDTIYGSMYITYLFLEEGISPENNFNASEYEIKMAFEVVAKSPKFSYNMLTCPYLTYEEFKTLFNSAILGYATEIITIDCKDIHLTKQERELAFNNIHSENDFYKLALNNILNLDEKKIIYDKYHLKWYKEKKLKFDEYFDFYYTFKEFVSYNEQNNLVQLIIRRKKFDYVENVLKDTRMAPDLIDKLNSYLVYRKLAGCD